VILRDYIDALKNYKGFSGDIVCHKTLAPGRAVFAPEKSSITGIRKFLMDTMGIRKLYCHQHQAIELIQSGIHTIVTTPTASGKSLIYNLPVIETLVTEPGSRALYLFPLKALAQDQLSVVTELLQRVNKEYDLSHPLSAAVYDGDLSPWKKSKIRKNPPDILLSNPEMLHLSLLAHHDLWEDFFAGLKYVVVDEVHTYRGVMGSNMAWVFRRFLRICRFYGAQPVFILCSATIDNPSSLASRLTGLDVRVVNRSGAPSGKKDVIIMRGLEGAARTAIALIHSAVHRKLKTICYTQSRKITELIAIWTSKQAGSLADRISAYRAGFLPEERRQIEKRLGSGDLLAVVTTSALELGIDIGDLDICILVGYPGTIMSFWQRAGRAGRNGRDSALIFVAHEDALDQYMINHPEAVFSMPPEKAVINPHNMEIMKQHLLCAAVELRLDINESFLHEPDVREAVSILEHNAELLRTCRGDHWYAARRSVHRDVNLRGTGVSIPVFIEKTKQRLGEIDRHRSFFETHEGAVYLHRGKTYVIVKFDFKNMVIEARQASVPYYTRARSSKNTTIIKQLDSCCIAGGPCRMGYGKLKITQKVTGYEKKLVATGKSIGIVPLDLPDLEFETLGLWMEIPDSIREEIEAEHLHFMGGIHAIEHAAIGIMPLVVMTDRNDLGGISIPFHEQIKKAGVFIYDGVPGGLGLARQAFDHPVEFLEKVFEVIDSCPCENGCPSCVHSPKCGSGNRPIDKTAALRILDMMLNSRDYQNFYHADPEPVNIVSEPAIQYDGAGNEEKKSEHELRYGVLDIETRRSAAEVGGWNKARKMGVSCAVLYDSKADAFIDYLQDDVDELCRNLLNFDLIIGFNIIGFDYKVLSGLSDFDFSCLPTLDILLKIHERLGYRLSLDHLATHTLGTGKTADGLMALKWWRQGKIKEIIQYCRQDVKVTRDLYLYGRENKFLVFRNKAGLKVRLPVNW